MNAKLLLAPAAAAWMGFFPLQASLSPSERALAPVPDADELDESDEAEWIEALRAPDLSERRKTYERLLDLAARSDEVRATVEGWAANEDEIELAWTAELLLRELDGGRGQVFRPGRALLDRGLFDRGHGFSGPGTDDLFRRLEEMLDQPMAPLFGLDPDDRFPSRPSTPRWMHVPPGGSGHSSSQGLRFEMGPDGVRVEVRESEDGDEKIRTYEAESLEALLEAHPELKDRLPGHAGVELPDVGLNERFLAPREDSFRFSFPHITRQLDEPRRDVLGIRVRTSESSTERGLEVVDVLPGSLAERLGIRAGEIVLSVTGVDVDDAADVKHALRQRTPAEAIEVEVVDDTGARHVRSWQPEC